jgi:hypothetical protein
MTIINVCNLLGMINILILILIIIIIIIIIIIVLFQLRAPEEAESYIYNKY